MGLDVNEAGAVLDVNGRPSQLLFAIGPDEGLLVGDDGSTGDAGAFEGF